MQEVLLGIVREHKIPPERRVAFLPDQLKRISRIFPRVKFLVQPYSYRIAEDGEFESQGFSLQEDLAGCDFLFGIKEPPIDTLVFGKTYFTFSHVAKEQPYNRALFREMIKNKITLIDYEYLKDQNGNRVVAFGRFAGIVGAWNGLIAYAKKHLNIELKRAKDCQDLKELYQEAAQVQFPPIRVVITGGGRVAQGAAEVLDKAGFKELPPFEYLYGQSRSIPTYTILPSRNFNRRKEDGGFDRSEFHEQPYLYESFLMDYLGNTDMLIAAGFWDINAPRLFEKEEISTSAFKPSVIADISCDINGGVPTTIRASTIEDPFFDINRNTQTEQSAFGAKEHITMMSIDNLPTELPFDASQTFGNQLTEHVIPRILGEVADQGMLEQATILKNGEITPQFAYLREFGHGA